MASIDLHGMGVALITPFKTDDSVDYEALIRMVDYLIENGTDYIVALGTTAETPCLFDEEKKEITRTIVERVNRRIPVILGIGGNCTRKILSQFEHTDFEGISAILSVVPYYNKPSQEGIYQHYKTITEAAPLPIVIYNVPGRTGTNMTAETTLRIAHDFSNVIAVKEASGNITQIGNIIKNKPSGFQVISGDDGLTFPIMALGGVGVISVIGNVFPKDFSRMVHFALESDFQSARTIHANFAEIFELLFVDGSPAGVKCMLNLTGLIENKLRLPLVPVRNVTFERISGALRKMNIL
jgi:4-hydroxy-tetrahydrodipicolinate synthase